MPFAELNIIPSVNTETTNADNPSGIQESNFIRWKANLPEKRGGCKLYINPNNKIGGTPTDLQPWLGINGEKLLGIGTDYGLYAYVSDNGSLKNISPTYLDSNGQTPPSFTTYAGTPTVRVTDTAVSPSSAGPTVYDTVVFNTPISVGGIILNGPYKITTALTSSSYEITASSNASASITNGGVLPQFSVVQTSNIITCTFPDHTYLPGDLISFLVPTSIAGITIVGSYIVREVTPGVSFTFIDDQAATSTSSSYMNNDVVFIRYWLTKGPIVQGSGYGLNAYGEYPYGQGASIPPLQGNQYGTDNWWLDNWGERLISCSQGHPNSTNLYDRGGPIFEWSLIGGYLNANIIDGAPIANLGAFVAMPQQQVVAWGSTYTGQVDPLQIRWSNVGDYNDWQPRVNNQAGGYRIPTGSRIVRGIQGQTQQFWFTDIDVYVSQYTGDPFVYSFNKIGSGCGLIAPRAVGAFGGSLFWMSQSQFFVVTAGSAPQPVPCSVWDFIFQNMKQGTNPETGMPYSEQVVCGVNTMFNEINWFFPSTNTPDGYPDAYVCFNVQYNEWDVGYMGRTAWYDQSALGPPIAANSKTVNNVQTGYVYQHETSYNLVDGNDQTIPINAWLKTGYFSLSNGQEIEFVDWLLPDMRWDTYALESQEIGATIKLTFYVTDYAGQAPRIYGPYSVTKNTQFICPRFRGRYVALKIESSDLNSFWRLGSIRYRYASSGRR